MGRRVVVAAVVAALVCGGAVAGVVSSQAQWRQAVQVAAGTIVAGDAQQTAGLWSWTDESPDLGAPRPESGAGWVVAGDRWLGVVKVATVLEGDHLAGTVSVATDPGDFTLPADADVLWRVGTVGDRTATEVLDDQSKGFVGGSMPFPAGGIDVPVTTSTDLWVYVVVKQPADSVIPADQLPDLPLSFVASFVQSREG